MPNISRTTRNTDTDKDKQISKEHRRLLLAEIVKKIEIRPLKNSTGSHLIVVSSPLDFNHRDGCSPYPLRRVGMGRLEVEKDDGSDPAK